MLRKREARRSGSRGRDSSARSGAAASERSAARAKTGRRWETAAVSRTAGGAEKVATAETARAAETDAAGGNRGGQRYCGRVLRFTGPADGLSVLLVVRNAVVGQRKARGGAFLNRVSAALDPVQVTFQTTFLGPAQTRRITVREYVWNYHMSLGLSDHVTQLVAALPIGAHCRERAAVFVALCTARLSGRLFLARVKTELGKNCR